VANLSSGWGSSLVSTEQEEDDVTTPPTTKLNTRLTGWGSSLEESAEPVAVSKDKPIIEKPIATSTQSGWGESLVEGESTVVEKEEVDVDKLLEKTEKSFVNTPDGISILPSADLDTETTDELMKTPFEVGQRSGADRTKEAWQTFLFPFIDDDGEELTEEAIADYGATAAQALTETTEDGRSVLSPIRGVTPDEKAIAALLDGKKGNTKFLMGLANLLSVGGAGALDVIEDTLEKMREQKIGGAIYDVLVKGANELRGVSGVETPEQLTDIVGAASMYALEFSESIPALGTISTLLSVRSLLPAMQAKTGVKANLRKEKNLQESIRNNVGGAEIATREAKYEANVLANEVAEANKDIRDELIIEYESRVGNKSISTEVNGHLQIDINKAKESAAETLRQPFEILVEDGKVSATEDPLAKLIGVEEGLVSPILNPQKLNALTAVIKDYKTKTKEAGGEDIFKKKRPLEAILEVTVMQDLDATSELIDILNKYNLNLEEFILGSVGSFSQAGKTLNVASQLKRVKPAGDLSDAKKKKILEAEASISNAAQRLENVRRGALVSKFATAMRNLESFGARQPIESMMNIIDAVTRSFKEPISLGPDPKGGFVGAGKTLFSRQTWKDSFGSYKYAFSRPDVAQGYLNLILDNPKFASQYSKLYDNLNEIQKASGRGAGDVKDKILSPLEDTVEMMNFANKWQETLTRNAIAMNELERLVRLEYGIDLIDAMQDGKLPALMNDATSVRPEGARSFSAIVADATDRALRVTYGSQPENDMFAAITNFLTSKKIGGFIPLTTIVEFPRFMFASMEFMAESSFGAVSPAMRKLIGAQKEPLTPKQHRAIQRNLVGLAAIGGAYLYRSSENAPERYEDVRVLGKDADTTTQFPLRQFLWIGEALKRLKEGTFDMWFDAKDAAETFLGSAFRTGTGNIIIEEVSSILDGTDVSAGKKAAEIAGESLSNYLTGYLNFFAQLPDFQRALPTDLEGTDTYRPDVYKEDPQPAAKTPQEAFMREISRGPKRVGITRTAEEERALPTKATPIPEDAVRPDAGWKTLLGISLKDQAPEDAEFVTRLGIPTWKIGSNSDIDEVKRFENEKISLFLPRIVEKLQYRQDKLKDKYYSQPKEVRDKITEEQYVLRSTRNIFEGSLSNFKSYLRSVSPAVADRFSVASSNYNRVPKKFRTEAYIKYVEINSGKEPDITTADALEDLTILAKELQSISKKAFTIK